MADLGVCAGSKLGAGVPRHAAAPLNLARAALRPPVASHPSKGPFAAPVHPTTRNPTRFRDLCPTVRRLDARSGFRARHHDEGARRRSLRPTPTLRGLDARQRPFPLHRKSWGPCSPDTPSVRLSRPTPRRQAFRLSTPDQPCAGWMRGQDIFRCSGIRDIAALTRPSPRPPPERGVCGFTGRHRRPRPCCPGRAA